MSENKNNGIWDKPLPLLEHKDTLSCFPVESFPKAVSDYVKSLAENTQTSIDMAAVIALGILLYAEDAIIGLKVMPTIMSH